jgi:hypothetical protein
MIYRRIMKNNYFLEKMVNERIEREREREALLVS